MNTRPSSPAARSRNPGFTLVELIISLAIVGVLFAIVGPAFNDFLGNQSVKTVTWQLLADLNLARSEAVKRRRAVTVADDTTWSNGWSLQFVDDNVTTVNLKRYAPGTPVAIAHSDSAVAVVFGLDGRVTAGEAAAGENYVFEICDAVGSSGHVYKRKLYFSPSGRPNIEDSRDEYCPD